MPRYSYDPVLKRRNMDMNTNIGGGVDRITELPECIIHYIMSHLPIKAVARTSVLSKTWYQIWKNYPVSEFQISIPINRRAQLPPDRLTFARRRNMAPCAMHKFKGVACPMYCPFSKVLPGRSENGPNQCKRILEIFTEEKLINCLGYIQDRPGAPVQLIRPSDAGNQFLLNVIDFVADIFDLRITAKQRMEGAVRLLVAAQEDPAVAATNIAASIALLKRDTDELPPPEPEAH